MLTRTLGTLKNERGQLLVELMVVIGLFAILAPVILTGYVSSVSGKAQQKERLEAISLLKEAEEAVRSIREADWENLIPLNTEIHTTRSGTGWVFTPTTETLGNFSRNIVISEVYRDVNGTILPTGTPDQIDPSTKKAKISVSWTKPIPSTVESTLYLTRYINNASRTETTYTDFNNGVKASVDITNTIDGEVILGPGGSADWCAPGNPIVSHNLPGNGAADNGAAGNVVAGSNLAYAGTGMNASSYPFYSIKINSSVFPPVIDLIGYYEAPGLKTSDVYGADDYAYLSPDKNTNEEVIILDVSGVNPSFVSKIDISGTKGSRAIFVSGNYLYFVGFNNKLYVYDVTNHSSPTAKGSITVGEANKIYVLGDYVYLAMNTTTSQLKVIDASDKDNLSVASSLTVNDKEGVDVFVRSYFDGSGDMQTRAYLITALSSGSNFFIVNANDPAAPTVIGGGYSTTPMDPKGITVIDERAIIVGVYRPQYQVLIVESDAYDLCAIVPKVGDPDIDDINDISSIRIDDHAYSYLVTGNTDKAFQIIEGGLGGGGLHVPSGIFESHPLDLAGRDVALNRFFVNYDKPADTDIKFQVSGADPGGTGCSDALYTFIGPDGTTSTYYSDGGFIPWNNDGLDYENPSRCFKYKVYLYTSDTSKTPSLYDFTVNYSP